MINFVFSSVCPESNNVTVDTKSLQSLKKKIKFYLYRVLSTQIDESTRKISPILMMRHSFL